MGAFKTVYLYHFENGKLKAHQGWLENNQSGDAIKFHGPTVRRMKCTVSKEEGEIYSDKLWLVDRNDHRAIRLMYNYYLNKKNTLERRIGRINEKLEYLGRLCNICDLKSKHNKKGETKNGKSNEV